MKIKEINGEKKKEDIICVFLIIVVWFVDEMG